MEPWDGRRVGELSGLGDGCFDCRGFVGGATVARGRGELRSRSSRAAGQPPDTSTCTCLSCIEQKSRTPRVTVLPPPARAACWQSSTQSNPLISALETSTPLILTISSHSSTPATLAPPCTADTIFAGSPSVTDIVIPTAASVNSSCVRSVRGAWKSLMGRNGGDTVGIAACSCSSPSASPPGDAP